MKTCTLLYKGKDALRHEIHDADIDAGSDCLVRIYTAVLNKDEAVAVAKEVRGELPCAEIIGCTGSGVIFRGKQYESETLIIIEQFAHTELHVSSFCFLNKTAAEVAREVADAVPKSASIMHILCGGRYPDVYEFTEEFKRLNAALKLVGGVAGDLTAQGETGYVFTDKGAANDGIVIASMSGKGLYSFAAVNIAHDPISPAYTVTKTDGSMLVEIENRSGIEWASEQFGMENLHEYHEDWQTLVNNDILVHFPLMLEYHSGASRFIRYDAQSGNIAINFSHLPAGEKFRVGYTSPNKCVQECSDICYRLVNIPIESLFCYSCFFRKMYLKNCAEWELRPFADYNICGVFMMGEIGNVHHISEFLNGSCCFIGVGEEDHGVRPDFSVFADLNEIHEDDTAVHNFVIKQFSLATSKENQELLRQMLNQQKTFRERLLVEPETGLNNMIMYSSDSSEYHFNKLFMCKIQNAPLLMQQLGPEEYRTAMVENANRARTSPQCARFGDKLHFYALNESTLFMVADDSVSESEFMQICVAQHDAFQLIDTRGVVVINRFVVVIDQPNLLESAMNTFEINEDLQTNFLICDRNKMSEAKDNEGNMLQVLSRVIEADGVIPYFQGIYDNNEKRITKYEALMRLRDTDGTIYLPGAFMEIAKKYHLYSILSKKMLSQVFDLFGGKKTSVSINLSALDINPKEMQDWILESLSKIGDASNFTFEILEDEEFQDMEILIRFIKKVREYGVSIAIDDFGSGYSNFMEIAKIEPDFLKVDGSIVKNIQDDGINHKVLANIVFLGKQLDANLVAEYVENGDIQDAVAAFGIEHSQGFYFAVPRPYGEIEIDETDLS